MHRIDGQNHLNNRFQGGDPIQRVDSTVVTPEWLNSVQEEIASAIEYFGLSLDKTNNQQLRDGLNRGIVPVGSIIPFSPGYFDNNANSNFQIEGPAGNTIVEINNFLPDSWRVCDGTAPNDPESSIFNAADRFLPNLTDSRFIQGGIAAGNSGSTNTRTLFATNLPPHTHNMNHGHSMNFPTDGNINGGGLMVSVFDRTGINRSVNDDRRFWENNAINFGNVNNSSIQLWIADLRPNVNNHSGNTGTGNGLNSTPFDNRPLYLSCFYIIRIK